MGFFEEATSVPAYAKIGIYGEAGSGKTTTASLFAIGLHKFIKSSKPIVFMDTETGSDYVRGLFRSQNIALEVAKKRSIDALLSVVPEAVKISDILIIDSVSHPYQDMLQSYLLKTKKKRLAFQDWNVLKPMFREFTDAYTVNPVHILVCGRSQGVWDYFKDDDGKMELHQIGTKMKVEKEMGYEPSLLIEMERVLREGTKGWTHRATVLKDRNPHKETTLDGKEFDDPTFADILPHIQCLNIGGEHQPVSLDDSQHMFNGDTGDTEWRKKEAARQIAWEEFSGFMGVSFPASTGGDKIAKLHLCQHIFGTTSGKALEANFSAEQYKSALVTAKAICSKAKNIQILMEKGADMGKLEYETPALEPVPEETVK